MFTVFLSYRQKDSKGFALALYDRLCQRYGEGSVFWDGRSVRVGEDYESAMLDAVRGSRVVIVVIGRDWLAVDENGTSRLENPRDAVRLELEEAFEHRRPLLPVLIDGATMPTSHSLPPTVSAIARRNAAALDAGQNFPHDVERLMVRIDELLAPRRDDPIRLDGSPRGFLGLIGSSRERPSRELSDLAHAVGVQAVKRGYALATSGAQGAPAVARAAGRAFLASKGIDAAPYLPALLPTFEAVASGFGGEAGKQFAVPVLFMIGGGFPTLAVFDAALNRGIAVLPIPSSGEAPFIAWRKMRDSLTATLGGALSLPEFRRLTEILPPDELAEIAVDLAERLLARPARRNPALDDRTD